MHHPEHAFGSPFIATEPAIERTGAGPTSSIDFNAASLGEAIESACARIPPLWPLKTFVAVNPFLGLSDQTYLEACATVRRIAHGELLMPASFYLQQLNRGRITEADLQSAIEQFEQARSSTEVVEEPVLTPEALLRQLRALSAGPPRRHPDGPIRTVADALNRDGRWARLTTEEISKWCAAHYDEGQASWQSPWRGSPPYVSWRRTAQFDRNPELNGFRRFRHHVAQLPFDPHQAIARVLELIGVPGADAVEFLHRALMSVAGWSAYVQYRVRERSRHGHRDDSLVHLLAIRLAYDYALFMEFGAHLPVAFWRPAGTPVSAPETTEPLTGESDMIVRYLGQLAYEQAFQRRLIDRLRAPDPHAGGSSAARCARPSVQAVFCIDVRSEVYRRALEAQSPDLRTHGFAGFFGVPIEYVSLGHSHGPAQCPVLIEPKFRVRETVAGATSAEVERILAARIGRKRAVTVWKAFKSSAISCFSYVETAGLLFAPKLFSDTVGWTHPVTPPGQDGLASEVVDHLGPSLEFRPATDSGTARSGPSGISTADRVELARAALRGMGLTGELARLVLLCGHGSTTVNNPYAAGLNCGACGGHTGEANARTAAAILNDPAVREALRRQGPSIPDDTWFLAGLHDTTTDEIRLYDMPGIPASHREDCSRLQTWLHAATQRTRRERAPWLGLTATDPARIERGIKARSRDWSQVRPEWGLAGNAAFIAAPRVRTRALDLGGRTFLHDYDPAADADGSLLELIMTAPMVVASWINLQYLASTVDPLHFGSGNKVIHNVVGTLGVLEGNGGDLRTGLPQQSVHNGREFMHEPLRLNVLIEASTAAIEQVVDRHPSVRQLIENGWINLFAITDEGSRYFRYGGSVKWRLVP